MPEKWTGEVIGAMHVNGIAHKDLANALGWNAKYLSTVLNGHRKPKGAEEKVRTALDGLISRLQ